MKILLLSHTALVTGGAEQCLLEYIDVLTSKGYKCKVVVPYVGAMTGVLSEKGIPWIVIGYGWATKPHRKVNPHRIMTSTGSSLVRLFQEVEKFKPNLIITNTAVIPWGLYAGRTFDIPNIVLVHEILSGKDQSLRIAPSYKEYGEILDQNADYIIYNSQFVKGEFAEIIKTPKVSQHILYPLPPLDGSRINRLFKENILGTPLRIAIFGALSPRKNQLEALQAVKILYDKGNKDFTLDLYGDTTANPSYTKMLKRFIRDNSLQSNAYIKGFSTNVYEKMNEYNIVLSTARYEPFGRTLIEGQLFGRIVITNDTGGGLELVEDARTGLVYQSGKPNKLAEKIQWIMDNHLQALTLGGTAKTEQQKKYVTTSRYDPLLEAVAYFEDYKQKSLHNNIYNPVIALFQYNHFLNNKYKNIYKITHNRFVSPFRSITIRALSKAKRIVRQLI